ncbi:hypothetical protein [Thalassotalea marina]|uniref:Uncharacterized protein n=1 Tax=Thalassotalea marina TaxID=1673741 RepID=A0A919BAQ0_9GAMM|nr:hypothetical protein [Thalassotalea marina]GHF79301.1 hypothetical protein GCM10017161_03090 [Thalassotalea marina]
MKNWWATLSSSEKSAMRTFLVIGAGIGLFVIGIKLGQLWATTS